MKNDKIWYLSQIDILSAMSDIDMSHMEGITQMTTAPKYSPIYLPGDPANSIYLLKRGRVRISKLSEEGKQMTLSILEPGNIFGEYALIDDSNHQTIAEAMLDTMLCVVQKEDFEAFLKEHPEVNLKVTKWIGQRLHNIENKVEDLVFKSAEQRLEELLVKLSEEYPQPVGDGVQIDLTLTHQDMGELTNIARPTVTDLLKRLESKGKIRVNKRKITVLAS